MKLLMSLLFFVFTVIANAGGEVPWPVEKQVPIRVLNLQGLWMSATITSPQLVYLISLEHLKSKTCPFRIHVVELNESSTKAIYEGERKVCSSNVRSIAMVLYDRVGRAKKYVHIVGVADVNGEQSIGFSIYDYENDSIQKDRVKQDLFYKVSL